MVPCLRYLLGGAMKVFKASIWIVFVVLLMFGGPAAGLPAADPALTICRQRIGAP